MGSATFLGTRVGNKYLVERVLGEGGMGAVALGKHEELGKKVAIKFLHEEIIAKDPSVITRFLREAQLACALQSEHVVHVFDVGRTDRGVPYMVMEYLEGSSLADELAAKKSLGVQQATDYVLQALEAIAEAHTHGIVHRDLKPDNLFLAKKGGASRTIKVLDFGISKSIGKEESHSLTQTSSILGSPLYMSPEQIRSSRDVTVRSDIWSIGVVLYELTEGVPPFQGESVGALFGMIQYVDPKPMTKVPAALEAVIRRCMTRDPEGRYANVAELARALAPFGSPAASRSVNVIDELFTAEPPTSKRDHVAVAKKYSTPPPFAPVGGPSEDEKSTRIQPDVQAISHSDTLNQSAVSVVVPKRFPAGVALAAAGLVVVIGGALAVRAMSAQPAASTASTAPRVTTEATATSTSTNTTSAAALPSLVPTITTTATTSAPAASSAPRPTSSSTSDRKTTPKPSASTPPAGEPDRGF